MLSTLYFEVAGLLVKEFSLIYLNLIEFGRKWFKPFFLFLSYQKSPDSYSLSWNRYYAANRTRPLRYFVTLIMNYDFIILK